MLRCSHVASLRAKLEGRILLGSHWAGAPRFAVASRLITPKRLGSWGLGAVARGYSTTLNDAGLSTRDDGTSLETPAPSVPDAPRRPKHKRSHEDTLLSIATTGSLHGNTGGVSVSRKVVQMELKWLQDPRALADRVGRLLNAGDVALAAELVRTAQKDGMECSVAWNHLLEHCMNNKSPRAAFKFYNDMKKRGRKPNSRTYTIMLNGLSKAGKQSGLNPVRTAMSIYRSIFAPNSFVEPHIIHSNAMLNVCARQGDMDSLWEVAGELPETGPGSPDSFTYTIILKAIKESTQHELAELDPCEQEKIFARKSQGVQEGKRVWADIVYRWKKGELTLDNHLVSAMASILLEGTGDRHCYEVFALFHQTTGLPILAKEPPPDTIRRIMPLKNLPREKEQIEDVPFVDEGGRLYKPSEPEPKVVEDEVQEESFEKLFNPVISSDIPPTTEVHALEDRSSVPTYIPLGNRELSMLLETCLAMTQALSVGRAYWNHLTQGEHGYKIEPDPGSFYQYLRLLRLGRSSRATVEVVRDQMAPAGAADGKAFHIALSCCRRDRKNMNVLKNANDLLRVMDTSLVLPDPRALEGYLDLVRILEENPQFLVSLNGLDVNKKRPSAKLEAMGRELQLNLLIAAVENLRPLVAKLNEAMEHGNIFSALAKSRHNKKNNQQKIPGAVALRVLTRTRMLIDSILKPENENLLSKTARARYEQESKDLRKYSRTEVLEKYQAKLVAPTPDQVLAFRQPSQAEPSL